LFLSSSNFVMNGVWTLKTFLSYVTLQHIIKIIFRHRLLNAIKYTRCPIADVLKCVCVCVCVCGEGLGVCALESRKYCISLFCFHVSHFHDVLNINLLSEVWNNQLWLSWSGQQLWKQIIFFWTAVIWCTVRKVAGSSRFSGFDSDIWQRELTAVHQMRWKYQYTAADLDKPHPFFRVV